MEKSAKSMLSVNSPSSPSPKSFQFADKAGIQESNPNTPVQQTKAEETGSGTFEKAQQTKHVSPPTLLHNEPMEGGFNCMHLTIIT